MLFLQQEEGIPSFHTKPDKKYAADWRHCGYYDCYQEHWDLCIRTHNFLIGYCKNYSNAQVSAEHSTTSPPHSFPTLVTAN